MNSSAIVTLGAGRGFVVATADPFTPQVIVTAAHCLPHLPTCAAVAND